MLKYTKFSITTRSITRCIVWVVRNFLRVLFNTFSESYFVACYSNAIAKKLVSDADRINSRLRALSPETYFAPTGWITTSPYHQSLAFSVASRSHSRIFAVSFRHAPWENCQVLTTDADFVFLTSRRSISAASNLSFSSRPLNGTQKTTPRHLTLYIRISRGANSTHF